MEIIVVEEEEEGRRRKKKEKEEEGEEEDLKSSGVILDSHHNPCPPLPTQNQSLSINEHRSPEQLRNLLDFLRSTLLHSHHANPAARHRPLDLPYVSLGEQGPIQVHAESQIENPVKKGELMGIGPAHQRRGLHDLHGGDVLHAQLIEGLDAVARPGGGNQDAGLVG